MRKRTKMKTQTQKNEMNVTALLAVGWLYCRTGTASVLFIRCKHSAKTWNVCRHAWNVSQLVMLTNTLSQGFQLRETEASAQKIIDLEFYVTGTIYRRKIMHNFLQRHFLFRTYFVRSLTTLAFVPFL
jgi:hypothetical protein